MICKGDSMMFIILGVLFIFIGLIGLLWQFESKNLDHVGFSIGVIIGGIIDLLIGAFNAI